MIYTLTDLNSWPLDPTGCPVFKDTGEALFYAQLIYKLPKMQERIRRCRREAYVGLQYQRETKDLDFDLMMIMAVRAQFFRECLEECQRIKDENLNH